MTRLDPRGTRVTIAEILGVVHLPDPVRFPDHQFIFGDSLALTLSCGHVSMGNPCALYRVGEPHYCLTCGIAAEEARADARDAERAAAGLTPLPRSSR
jgi:hypothetical protein